MLRADNIHKYYGDLHVLKGVSLSVAAGEVVAIVGKSGAGKTTLLHILSTLDKAAHGGDVWYSETPISKLKSKELARFRNQQIGFVFQFHNLLEEFTALENVCLPAMINGQRKNDIESYAQELLGQFGLAERADHKPSQLSGGEQQRVAVARALINRPSIVFADEPSGNLDSKSSKEMHQLILDLRDRHQQTFVIVTHNEELANMCDRIITLQDGKIG